MTHPLARPNNPIVFAQAPVEAHLRRYRAAGLSVSDHIADWEPGLRNGFVELWPEYLEILTVADEDVFARDASPELRAQRARGGIHALELYSDDTPRMHAVLTDAGRAVPEVRAERLATTAPDARPDFYFLALPHLLPDTEVAVMTSTYPGAAIRRYVQVAPNGVFAVGGLTIVDDDPPAAARRWGEVTAPGVHELTFLTRREWRERCPAAGPGTGVVCVHLLSVDVERSVAAMVGAGWLRGDDVDGHAHVLPHPADGMRFTVGRGDPEEWLRRREEVHGERLELRWL